MQLYAGRAPPALRLPDVWSYERLASRVEYHVQRVLDAHPYNTVGNFLAFYEGFKAAAVGSNLSEYYQSYAPPITPKHHTCVGLAIELRNRLRNLDKQFGNVSESLYLTSCEEGVDPLEYLALFEDMNEVSRYLDKEHVLLAMQFEIDGRRGVLLCDPGYHVGRVVTVMHDQAYPHTGWFVQSEEKAVCKEYRYEFSAVNADFVEWTERATRAGVRKTFAALIYVRLPYLTAVDVTERRNLVYDFRSLLSRDTKGHVRAGIYFKVRAASDEFTMFYRDDDGDDGGGAGKRTFVLNFDAFLRPRSINDNILNAVKKCNDQLNMKDNELIGILVSIAKVLNDKGFLSQLLEINDCVNAMAENN